MGKDQFCQTLVDIKNVHQPPIVGIKILKRANPSLGHDITTNIKPQIFLIHPILKQHRTHLKKFFISIFISKDYPSHEEFEILIEFTEK